MFRSGFICILSVSLAASAMFAQVTTADIVGRVTDSSTAILPNAKVTVQNLDTAEVGRTAGGVVNLLSKSGTNAIHGTVYEFFRNDKMDARNFFAPTKPKFRQNQYGGSVGGPVRKDKTFFFGDVEEFTQVQGQTFTANVPTDAVKTGNFGGIAKIYDPNSTVCTAVGVCSRTEFLNDQIPLSRLNSLAQKYMQLYPRQNKLNTSSTGLYTSSFPKTQKYGTLDARVDQRFSEKDYFYARYSFNDTTTFIPGNLPAQTVAGIGLVDPTGSTAGIVGPALQRVQGLQLNHVHIIRGCAWC